MSAPRPLVGFDLDLTLVDSRERIGTCLSAALGAAGVVVAPATVHRTIGLPLTAVLELLAPDLDDAARAAVAADYRARHDADGAPPVTPMPGAAEALAAVRAAGGRAVVVSAKLESAVHAVLAEAGLAPLVDEVVGGRFAEGKGEVLLAMGATAYVGDHPGDVVAALTGGAEPLSVLTGGSTAHELREAGAGEVVPDLTGFPAWLAGHVQRLG